MDAAIASSRPAARLPVPEPDLTPGEIIQRAIALRPKLRANQEICEERGGYTEELHEDFIKAGFYRMWQPRMFGGYEFSVETYYQVMIEISTGHPSVGWCLALACSHALLVASHWPEQAQVEAFGKDGQFAAPHRAIPHGTIQRVDGGFIVDGVWPYCSGVTHATHLVATTLLHENDEVHAVNVLVPRKDFTVLDDWGGDKVMGMRASGSNSVRVSNVFVPDYMCTPFDNFFALDQVSQGTPGTRLHGNPMYLGQIMGPYHASLVAPVIGAARASLDEYRDILLKQKILLPPFTPRAEHYDFQRPFGHAIAMTDAAEAILIRACQMQAEYNERWARTGQPFAVAENMRLWTLIQQAGKLASDATELLFQTAGSYAARKGSRLMRYFNDVQMYRGHVSSQVLNFASMLGRAELGMKTGLFDL